MHVNCTFIAYSLNDTIWWNASRLFTAGKMYLRRLLADIFSGFYVPGHLNHPAQKTFRWPWGLQLLSSTCNLLVSYKVALSIFRCLPTRFYELTQYLCSAFVRPHRPPCNNALTVNSISWCLLADHILSAGGIHTQNVFLQYANQCHTGHWRISKLIITCLTHLQSN